jgi:hypothetical protein
MSEKTIIIIGGGIAGCGHERTKRGPDHLQEGKEEVYDDEMITYLLHWADYYHVASLARSI